MLPSKNFSIKGGYHIERNPITGGARLVPPSQPGNMHAIPPKNVICTISLFVSVY